MLLAICQPSNSFPACSPPATAKVSWCTTASRDWFAISLTITNFLELEPLLNTMIRSTLKASTLASRRVARNNGAIRTMAKEIKFGVEGRAAMLKGVETLADAVQVRS